MTIVSTEVLTASHVWTIVIVAASVLFLLTVAALFLYESFSGAFFDGGSLIYGLLALVVVVFAIFTAYKLISVGPYVLVHAIVDDWGEVHDAGYKIIDQQGDLVTLRKARP